MAESPPVPLTLEGAWVLHQMFRFDWKTWRGVPLQERERIAVETTKIFQELEHDTPHRAADRSALYSLLGHKGDLMMIHLRNSVSELSQVELGLAQSEFHTFLEASSSYLSVVELGLYESSMKTFAALHAEGLEPHTPAWNAAITDVLQRQSDAMATRLRPAIPPAKYLCFYPMDRKRGEQVNWYTVPMIERQRMMRDHGMIGRRYGDRVRQIISGSIGLDDWEWGVDLFADDPVTFKQLIYEMRFDEASALYAAFGPFYVGVRLPPDKLEDWLMGKIEEPS